MEPIRSGLGPLGSRVLLHERPAVPRRTSGRRRRRHHGANHPLRGNPTRRASRMHHSRGEHIPSHHYTRARRNTLGHLWQLYDTVRENLLLQQVKNHSMGSMRSRSCGQPHVNRNAHFGLTDPNRMGEEPMPGLPGHRPVSQVRAGSQRDLRRVGRDDRRRAAPAAAAADAPLPQCGRRMGERRRPVRLDGFQTDRVSGVRVLPPSLMSFSMPSTALASMSASVWV